MIEQSASLSPPTSLQNPESYCSLCQQDHSIELLTLCGPLIGPFEFKSNSLYFHLYCLYFSWDVWIDSMTNINRELHKSFFIFPKLREINPSNEEKLLILPNIRNVLGNYQRTSLHRCDICQKIRATVACSISNCPSQYHFPCAQGYVKFFYCSMAFILVCYSVHVKSFA